MPKFRLNKLVRDKLPEEYRKSGQNVKYRSLSPIEHKKQLIRKIIEEASELRADSDCDELADEIADIYQVLEDLIKACNVSKGQISTLKRSKYEKKGGFRNGTFVDTIELKDGDEWVEYYRRKPDVFIELPEK